MQKPVEQLDYTGDLVKKLVQIPTVKELDKTLSVVFKHQTVGKRFLAKMEVNRLKTSCIRSIDLRDKPQAQCQPYLFQSVSHYLTLPAIKLFEEMVQIYGGSYTTGVYEAICSSVDNLLAPTSLDAPTENQFSASEYDTFNTAKLGFGLFQTRSENRIYFKTQIIVSTDIQEFEASTSDISKEGVRLLLPESVSLERDSTINIIFSGLRNTYVDDALDTRIAYKVVGLDDKDGRTYVRAVRTSHDNMLDVFFHKFTQSQQNFQRIDSSDIKPTLLNKGYETLYAQKSVGLPLFFDRDDSLAHVLVSENNRPTLSAWINHLDQNSLALALPPNRIRMLLDSKITNETILSFTVQSQDKITFCVATLTELKKAKLEETFLAAAIKYKTLKVYQLKLTPNSSEISQLGLEHDGISVITKERLSNIATVGVFTDITSTSMVEDFKNTPIEAKKLKDVAGLKLFILRGTNAPLDLVPVNYYSKRKSLRYIYNMQVRACHDDQIYSGQSNNFSVDGLSINLDRPIKAITGDKIAIEVPNQIGAKLSSQPYRIVRMNKAKTAIYLELLIKEHKAENKRFLDSLIRNNHTDISADHGPSHSKGMLDSLVRLYSRFGGLSNIYISKNKYKLEFNRCASSYNSTVTPLLSACNLSNGYEHNVFPIVKSAIGSYVDSDQFKSYKVSQHKSFELFIYIDNTKEVPRVITKVANELGSTKIRRMFVQNARRNGLCYVIQAQVIKTNTLDLSFVDAHLSQLRKYARYHIDDVKSELTSVFGCINLVDVTNIAMRRLGVL